MANTEVEKDCLERLKELGFVTIEGEFVPDSWGNHTLLHFTPELPNDNNEASDLGTYVWDLVYNYNPETADWDFIEGTVVIDVANRKFDFDLEGERTEEVEAHFVVEESEGDR